MNKHAPQRLLEGARCVVTGAASGIGAAISATFLEHGATVSLMDRDTTGLEQCMREFRPRFGTNAPLASYNCDVAHRESFESALRASANEHGAPTVMVNNAGIIRDATLRRMSESSFDEVVATHLKGAWLGTKIAADLMREHEIHGAIINMSSISGKVGMRGQSNYSAAKAGVIGLTKAAAKELGHVGIRVNAIAPGIIETPLTADLPPTIRASKLAEVPLGRFGTPDEVANVALFLACPWSSYLTGAVIEVTGGRHM